MGKSLKSRKRVGNEKWKILFLKSIVNNQAISLSGHKTDIRYFFTSWHAETERGDHRVIIGSHWPDQSGSRWY